MPRKYIRRLLPDPHWIRDHKSLRFLGDLLHSPGLWHLNKRSVSGAFSVGLFTAFLPIPLQMAVAAVGAIAFRVNLPLSVVVVWITNPVTIPPIFYFAYRVGAWILEVPRRQVAFELSLEWLQGEFLAVWQPVLLGCLILGVSAALLGNLLVRLTWRVMVIHSWQERRRRMRHKRLNKVSGQ